MRTLDTFRQTRSNQHHLRFCRTILLFTIYLFPFLINGDETGAIYAQCTPTSYLSANITTSQDTGCAPLTVSFDANITKAITSEELVEKYDLTFKSPSVHTTEPLVCGQHYLLRISGTYSVWINIYDVLDAAYRYYTPAGQFGNHVSAPYNFRPDNDVQNTTNHTYDYCIIGRGCPLEITFSDQVFPNKAQFPGNNWTLYPYPDNSGSLHYELYKEPTTYNYSWNFGDPVSGVLNTSTLKNPEHIFTSPGTYTVQLNVVNSTCTKDTSVCTYSVTKTIKVQASPNARITGSATICSGDSATLTATGGTNYLWNTGATTIAISQAPGTDTTYSVIVFDNSCSDTASIAIKVNPLPIANAGDDTIICPNNSIELNASGGIKYQWNPSQFISNDTIANPTMKPDSTITYIVKITDSNSCSSYDTIHITVDKPPIPQFIPNNLIDNIPLTVNFTNTTVGGTSYLWQFGDEVTSEDFNPSYTYNSAGSYPVMLIAYNINGCSDTAYGNIQVLDNESELWIPNAFTPGDDEKNDLFGARSKGIIEFQGMIFNRWGELIYEWNDINRGWNGKYKNHDSPSGVYVYVIKAKGSDNRTFHRSGHFTLLR